MSALNVLLIDESDRDATQLSQTLSNAGFTVAVTRVDTRAALAHELRRPAHWDIAVSDFALPSMTGRDALELVAAGASAVALGTILFADPLSPARVREELRQEAAARGFENPLAARSAAVAGLEKTLQIALNGTA